MLVNGTKKQAASPSKALLLTGKTGAQTGTVKTKILNQTLLSRGKRIVFKQPFHCSWTYVKNNTLKKHPRYSKGKLPNSNSSDLT